MRIIFEDKGFHAALFAEVPNCKQPRGPTEGGNLDKLETGINRKPISHYNVLLSNF